MARKVTEDVETTGRLIGYARVSTIDQQLHLQMDALVRAGVDPADIHTDKASGASDKRRGFDAMFKDIRAGDTLVIWKLDRLGRRLKEMLETLERIECRGVQLRSLTEQIDTSTPIGKFALHILAAMAEMERNLTIERTKAGQAAARERGRHPGRRKRVSDDRIIKARARFEKGESVEKLATQLGLSKAGLYYRWKRMEGDGN